jgi:hypothetical protein
MNGLSLGLALLCLPLAAHAADKPRPLMRDFMGLCVHTVTFKPELYQPIATRVRDYHPFDWDVGQESDHPTTFPMARNKVDWNKVYGSWKKAGYRNGSICRATRAPTAARSPATSDLRT